MGGRGSEEAEEKNKEEQEEAAREEKGDRGTQFCYYCFLRTKITNKQKTTKLATIPPKLLSRMFLFKL